MNWRSLILVVWGVVFSVTADILLKKSANGNMAMFGVGFALYACAAIPVALVYRITTFGRVFLLWEAMNAILCIATAKLVFREHFGVREVAALLAIGAAMLILKGNGS
jgi:multidrug transporter EmrE-like cation transporter